MPHWEVCHISTNHATKGNANFITIQDTLQGDVVIDQSLGFEWSGEAKWQRIQDTEHSKLVARFLANGWERFQVDSSNEISFFRRQVP